MRRVQLTRATLSIRIETWARLMSYCKRTKQKAGALVERNLVAMLDRYGEPEMSRDAAVESKRRRLELRKVARRHSGVRFF
jgi:hypothetical protein